MMQQRKVGYIFVSIIFSLKTRKHIQLYEYNLYSFEFLWHRQHFWRERRRFRSCSARPVCRNWVWCHHSWRKRKDFVLQRYSICLFVFTWCFMHFETNPLFCMECTQVPTCGRIFMDQHSLSASPSRKLTTFPTLAVSTLASECTTKPI